MDQVTAIPAAVVLASCVLAGVTDVRAYKIHNFLTIPLFLSGLAYHAVREGAPGLTASGWGAAAGFAVFFVPYLIGVMGAGDVKLMAAIGAWLGATAACGIALVGCLAAGLYSAVVLARQKRLGDSWTAMRLGWRRLRLIGQHLLLDDVEARVRVQAQQPGRGGQLIPFSLMIGIGVVALLIQTVWMRPVNAAKETDNTTVIQKTVES